MAEKTAVVRSVSQVCFSSLYLTGCLEDWLRRNGYRLVGKPEDADLVALNGCNVNDGNVAFFREYEAFARLHPSKRVLACGCTPDQRGGSRPSNFHALPYGRLVRDPGSLDAAAGASAPFLFHDADPLLEPRVRWLRGTWKEMVGLDLEDVCYLRISTGCDSACAYCAIRKAKGSVSSVPLPRILAAFERGLAEGRRKFWLVTDDAGAWGQDLGAELPDLLAAMSARAPEAKVLINEMHPSHALRLWPRLEPLAAMLALFVLPLESGSPRVLKLMRRGYRLDDVLGLARKVKRAHPEVLLSTEMIVGFPSETRADLERTIAAARRFDLTTFLPMRMYPNIDAASMPRPVPPEEIRARLLRVLAAGRRSRRLRSYDVGGLCDGAGGEGLQPVVWVTRPASA